MLALSDENRRHAYSPVLGETHQNHIDDVKLKPIETN